MPLNTLRLNHLPSSHPNDRVVFIKALPRPPSQGDEYDRAEQILKAVAAQCLPIMKEHHLSVTTLEEHEPNREFLGRNFNHGEVIQLVIKSQSGAWLPVRSVIFVCMHELAHNTEMNHGKNFWKLRNQYCEEVKLLWTHGYTGEGFWSQGRVLGNLEREIGSNFAPSEELEALPLCGGTYRRRTKKRRSRQSESTWREKRDKRIERKFGKNGQSLGEDEDKRLSLDISNKGALGRKPRVAQSKRGRELRAAAALARFGVNKMEVEALQSERNISDIDTAEESEFEDADLGTEDAVGEDGEKITDASGNPLIRICGGREAVDENEVKNEWSELNKLCRNEPRATKDMGVKSAISSKDNVQSTSVSDACESSDELSGSKSDETSQRKSPAVTTSLKANLQEFSCPLCSWITNPQALTCAVCGHVLDPRKDTRHWRCSSASCRESSYVHCGDMNICINCGTKKPI